MDTCSHSVYGPLGSQTSRTTGSLDPPTVQAPLARRIASDHGTSLTAELLQEVYRELADCLADGRQFERRAAER
jgi:hypothetical protein